VSSRVGIAAALVTLLFVLVASASRVGSAQGARSNETRALWILRTSLTSPETIARVVRHAKTNGFNTLLVQVRARGDAYFTGGREPRASEIAGRPGFDPLGQMLDEAHRAGLLVHAWTTINLVSSAVYLPRAQDHLVRRHPAWLMVPRVLAGELNGLPSTDPRYVARLARWTRARPQEVEGLYASPINPEAVAHTVATIAELVDRYPLDGVHLDYVRYPTSDFDYSRAALVEFRRHLLTRLAPAEVARLDNRAKIRPLLYTEMFPQAWEEFRRARLTDLVARLRGAIKARRPDAIVSAAVVPDQTEAERGRLQEWRRWLELGLLDVVCPMAYTPDPGLYAAWIAAARRIPGAHGLWAGIGAYRLGPPDVVRAIETAREAGASGIALFSYDSIVNGGQRDYLASVARASFAEDADSIPGPP
jgi:uncharacterized lipoprotein YddW (UPF0748 family)